ncbi:cyclic nucleotide-binding domain-containing protein [Candidatus Gracilibacteria bacterium]|nr:cyclic nucleotide-binding domain-containing protein [Candidatus Gracilibacteria bacterium]
MIDLNFLGNCKYFEKIEIDVDQLLFDEGEHDENLYIIYDGELIVEKRVKQGDTFKILSYIRTGNIVGEGGLTRNQKKEVRIKAARKTVLLKILGRKFVDFVREFPEESYELLIHIIAHSNDRLLKANSETTANYEITQAVAHIKNFDTKSIEQLLETIQVILDSQSIIYLEKNSIMTGYYKIKYSHGIKGLLGEDLILSFGDEGFTIQAFQKQKSTLMQSKITSAPLKHGGKLRGYLLVSRSSKQYNENEQKLLENAAVSFAGVIGHKEILEIEKNKKHIKNI